MVNKIVSTEAWRYKDNHNKKELPDLDHLWWLLVSRSGLMGKHGITSTGLIDEGYTGEIVVTLFNHSDEDYMVYACDRISQLVILPVVHEEIEVVGKLDENSDRGDAGFGSTGV